MALPETILLKYPDQANSQENPYIAKNWDEIKACLAERLIYAEVDDSLANTTIDLNDFRTSQGTIRFNCKYFNGKKVTIKNLYTTNEIMFYFNIIDSNDADRVLENINFINCYQNSSSTSAYFFRIYSEYTFNGTMNHFINNCKFSGMNYAEQTYFAYNTARNNENYCINKLIFNSCSFNYRSIYPIKKEIFSYHRYSGITDILYDLINCNCYFDLPNGFYDGCESFSTSQYSQYCKSFIGCYDGLRFTNCKIKVKIGGDQKNKTLDQSHYSYYTKIYSKNTIYDFDFYENFVPPKYWFVFSYNQTIINTPTTYPWNDDSVDRAESVMRPQLNNQYITTTSLIITDRIQKYLYNKILCESKARTYIKNYYKSLPEYENYEDDDFIDYDIPSNFIDIANYLFLQDIYFSYYTNWNNIWYIDWWRPKLTSYELVPCTEAQTKNKLFLLEHYFPLMWESDDDEI